MKEDSIEEEGILEASNEDVVEQESEEKTNESFSENTEEAVESEEETEEETEEEQAPEIKIEEATEEPAEEAETEFLKAEPVKETFKFEKTEVEVEEPEEVEVEKPVAAVKAEKPKAPAKKPRATKKRTAAKIKVPKIKVPKHTVKISKANLWKKVSIGLFALLIISIFTQGFTDAPTLFGKKSGEVTGAAATSTVAASGDYGSAKLEFYVMSQCPYGTQVEDAVKPVLELLGESVDFELNFIANDNGDGTFRALHGQTEVDGNIAQLCAAKYNPDKYMEMVVCMNKDMRSIPGNWESCASQSNLEVDKIKQCFEGNEGEELLRASIQKTNAIGATGSPTILLNGNRYNGGRDSLSFQRALCTSLQGHPACDEMPACGTDADCTAQPGKIGRCENAGTADAACTYTDPVAIEIIVISDSECSTCDTSRIKGITQQLFLGATFTDLDYEDEAAQALIQEMAITLLPAYIFGPELETTGTWATNTRIRSSFIPRGDNYMLSPQAVGATHNPAGEVCDNGKDDRDNDGLVDCLDDECAGKIICREEVPQKLDLFVMSQCPFGTRAEESMKEVLANFGDNIDFGIHYIANDNGDGTFTSLHGQPEVDGNIIQLCVADHYPSKLMDFIWCQNEDMSQITTNWEGCAETLSINKEVLKQCFEGSEGVELLSENIKMTNDLAIGASPTWLANNQQIFSALDPEAIKVNFCNSNPGLSGCENTLSGQAPSASAGSAPAGGACGG